MLSRISLEHRYIIFNVLNKLVFYNVVWLYFYRIYITDWQIGLLDGMAFFIGLLFEIPSGAIADAIGRKKIVSIGQFLVAVGILIQVFFPTFWMFIFGQSILVIGMSFVSGSDDALFFSALRYNPHTSHWKKLVTRTSKWILSWSLFAIITGAYLHTINPAYPWYLTAIATVVSIFIIQSVHDSWTYKTPSHTFVFFWKIYLDTLSGIKMFFRGKIYTYIPIIIGLQAILYTYENGLFRQILLDRFNFSPFLWSIAIGGVILASIWWLHELEKRIDTIEEKSIFRILSITTVGSLIVSIWDIGYWGWIVLFILYISERIAHTYISDGVNKHSADNERATLLSVGSFLKWAPYILLAPLIWYLNTSDSLEYFLIGWSVVIVISLSIYYRLCRSR
jgi:MFS family permease